MYYMYMYYRSVVYTLCLFFLPSLATHYMQRIIVKIINSVMFTRVHM